MTFVMAFIVALALVAPAALVATFTLAIVVAIIMPVVAVTFVAAVADYYLVSAAPVGSIPGTVNVVAFPRITLIYHYFVAMVTVVVTVPYR